MQKAQRRRSLSILFTLVLCGLSLFPMHEADAGRGGGGRGGGGGASRGGGGGSRSGSVNRGGGGNGASPRVNTNVSTQNKGNFNSRPQPSQPQRQNVDRSQAQQNYQNNAANRQGNYQSNSANRQGERTERQGERQDQRTQGQSERTDRQDTRQNERTDRQDNRQDFVEDNWDDRHWYGGGWYGGGYYVPPGWGWVGLTTGLVIGAAVAQAPPYYDTIYVGSTTYIYSDGVYMQPSGSTYTVVAPPSGAVVTYLPSGCTAAVMNGVQYQNCSGVYYEPVFQNGSTAYRVVQL